MSRVKHDFLPDAMTDGERAALADATASGWIIPPVFCSINPVAERGWFEAHLRYLERRGLVAKRRYRIDGRWSVKLNRTGLAGRDRLVAEDREFLGWLFGTGPTNFPAETRIGGLCFQVLQ